MGFKRERRQTIWEMMFFPLRGCNGMCCKLVLSQGTFCWFISIDSLLSLWWIYLQGGPPQLYLLVYNPHYLYVYDKPYKVVPPKVKVGL